jgi:hypothetical protein
MYTYICILQAVRCWQPKDQNVEFLANAFLYLRIVLVAFQLM